MDFVNVLLARGATVLFWLEIDELAVQVTDIVLSYSFVRVQVTVPLPSALHVAAAVRVPTATAGGRHPLPTVTLAGVLP